MEQQHHVVHRITATMSRLEQLPQPLFRHATYLIYLFLIQLVFDSQANFINLSLADQVQPVLSLIRLRVLPIAIIAWFVILFTDKISKYCNKFFIRRLQQPRHRVQPLYQLRVQPHVQRVQLAQSVSIYRFPVAQLITAMCLRLLNRRQ